MTRGRPASPCVLPQTAASCALVEGGERDGKAPGDGSEEESAAMDGGGLVVDEEPFLRVATHPLSSPHR